MADQLPQNQREGSGAGELAAPLPPTTATRVPEPLRRYAQRQTSILGDQSRSASSEQTTGVVSES